MATRTRMLINAVCARTHTCKRSLTHACKHARTHVSPPPPSPSSQWSVWTLSRPQSRPQQQKQNQNKTKQNKTKQNKTKKKKTVCGHPSVVNLKIAPDIGSWCQKIAGSQLCFRPILFCSSVHSKMCTDKEFE